MKTQHTPGPWDFDQIGHQVFTDDNLVICTLPLSVSYEQKKRRENDARLIACAPELLESLENLVTWTKNPNRHADDMCDILVRADNVLSKAKGEI